MPAVSDSSLLILFAAIDRLDLVHEVFSDVGVPPAVWEEIVVVDAGRGGSTDVESRVWISRRPLPVPGPGDPPIRGWGRGETEAITLARSYPRSASVILDDLQARRVASGIGLTVTGSVGVLLAAKRVGIIPSIPQLLAQLRNAGLYLSDAAVVRSLSLAGEE